MTSVSVKSSIPQAHPAKAAVEKAVREALEALPGTWIVTIRPAGLDWAGEVAHTDEQGWSVDVNRTGNFWGLRIPPEQQNPEGVVALLRATLRHI